MYMENVNELWQKIVDFNIANDDELRLITDINGYSVDTLNDVIYARTGYHNIEQIEDEEG